jgi:hypothetical protein
LLPDSIVSVNRIYEKDKGNGLAGKCHRLFIPLSRWQVLKFWLEKKGVFIGGSSGFTDTTSLGFVSGEVGNPCRTSKAALLLKGFRAISKLL